MNSFPTPDYVAPVEHMGPHFTKIHFPTGPLHIFTQPDTGDAHDHPWSFTTHVRLGGYVEEVYTPQSDGTVKMEVIERKPGTSHVVKADTIHRIISLPSGFCITQVEPGIPERKSGFYRFGENGISHRYWDEHEFKPWRA
jgi:hypothetical protein